MSAAIDTATAQGPTTTVNGAVNGDEAVSKSAAEGRRLYIGNLAYATTEGELKDFFKDYLVESTSIPTNPRTSRPVGYAFVDVSTPSEADRAVTEMNGKSILDRKVSVQLARKPEEAVPEGDDAQQRRRRSATRGRGRGRGARRGGRGGRGKDDAAAPADTTNMPAQVLPLTETTTNGNAKAADSNATKDKGPRTPKTRGPPEDGVPSKNKVMVANLPFDLTEDKLKEIFKDYNPTAAKLALRPIPRFMVRKLAQRGEARKGRGFAFVTLESEEMQLKAITEMNGKEIEGRELAVKIAIDSPGKEEDALNAQAAQMEGKENSTAEGSGSLAATSA